MRTEKISGGAVIFRQGDASDCMYEIRSGRVGIYLDYGGPNELKLTEQTPGQTFGEMGLLDDAPRSATAVSLEDDTVLICVTEEDFSDYVAQQSERMLYLLQQMQDRLRRNLRDYEAACRTVWEAAEADRAGTAMSPELLNRIAKYTATVVDQPLDVSTLRSAASTSAVSLEKEALTELSADELMGDPDRLLSVMKSLSAEIRENTERYFAVCCLLSELAETERSGAERSDTLRQELETVSSLPEAAPITYPGQRSAFMNYVLEDLASTEGKREVVRAGMIERWRVKFIDPEEMHANPDDDFSKISVGPCDRIINEYVRQIPHLLRFEQEVFSDPVLVYKLRSGGYLILNGHHRWAAALKTGLAKLRAVIVNPPE